MVKESMPAILAYDKRQLITIISSTSFQTLWQIVLLGYLTLYCQMVIPLTFIRSLLTSSSLSYFQHSIENGHLPPSLNQASISLLLKKDRTKLTVGSFVLSHCLMWMSKLLQRCLLFVLESVFPNIISEEQTGFIKN